ncbi:hypothetical protein [Brevundimonas lenta]|uniref:Uncharacterized protein n=1 Tax=Brevundimonas lenta TaxID=424796 RepID=A0A7W6JCW6_9CAUL|nr:hypothetical protein [Brevundimonas lenta]MBB4082808.1 hypothetical protein [Brevundimonas lenta]
MLQTVTVQASNPKEHGQLAEALVYFPKTRFVASTAELLLLCVRWGGFDTLHRILDTGDVEIVLDGEPLNAMPLEANYEGTGGTCLLISKPTFPAKEEFVQGWMQNFGITRANRLAATRLMDRVAEVGVSAAVFAGDRDDVLNEDLVTKVARRQIAAVTGVEPQGRLRFEPHPEREQIYVPHTDLEFPDGHAGTMFAKLGPESVIAALAEARREIIRSADGYTDMWLMRHAMDALEAKLECLAVRSSEGMDQVRIFETVTFEKRSIAQAVSSGARSPVELAEFLEHADTRKWKSWLASQKPEARLLEAYQKEVFSRFERFASLRGRVATFAVMQGVGLVIGAATGGMALIPQTMVQIGAAVAGEVGQHLAKTAAAPWKPTQWAHGRAREFLSVEIGALPDTPWNRTYDQTVVGAWPRS